MIAILREIPIVTSLRIALVWNNLWEVKRVPPPCVSLALYVEHFFRSRTSLWWSWLASNAIFFCCILSRVTSQIMRNSLAPALNFALQRNQTCFPFHNTKTWFARSGYRWPARNKVALDSQTRPCKTRLFSTSRPVYSIIHSVLSDIRHLTSCATAGNPIIWRDIHWQDSPAEVLLDENDSIWRNANIRLELLKEKKGKERCVWEEKGCVKHWSPG